MIVKMNTGLNGSETVKRVRTLLACIPLFKKDDESIGFQAFYGLRLIRADGVKFVLSMQGSQGHYCSPRECLPSLSDYESVEIGIFADKSNTENLYRLGRVYEGGRFVENTSDERKGWLQPLDVGFKRILNSTDDVVGWVPMNVLVADLADFFDAGGAIDTSDDYTKTWADKIMHVVL